MSAAEKSKKSGRQHLVDVQKPGTTSPSPTSRPVIVGNRPVLKDPMVVDESNDNEEGAVGPPKLSVADKPKLHPLSQDLAEEGPAEANTTEATEATLTTAEATDEPKTEADHRDEAEPPGVAKPAPAKTEEAEAAERAKHDAEIQKLVDSRQYALPIKTTEQRNSKRVVIIGVTLSVVLLLLWLNVALDAGIIRLGDLQPLTNFFPN